ncbi:unnamed protein product [Ectocarpus sp. CCAP 1310/34]|nr:unnamed protein product [Ectocarpus sp. CCAP 1310/34]
MAPTAVWAWHRQNSLTQIFPATGRAAKYAASPSRTVPTGSVRVDPPLQIIELLESTAADSPLISPAALLCRVEGLLLRGTGATSADALLVDHWFNKLLHFSPATASGSGGGDGEAKGAQGTPSRDRRSFSDGNGGSQSQKQLEQQQQQQQQRQHEVAFNTRAVCNIGEGIAGIAAMTGRKLQLKDCSTRQQRRRGKALYGTEYTSGSVVCWPVSALPTEVGVTRAEAETSALEQLEDVDGDDETEEARPSPGPAERVLAVLQVHCADGVLSAAAVEALHGLGRLLVPLLTEALARDEEYVRHRSTEALLSLSNISPRDVGLIAMVEEVVRVAQTMTEAERVCLFFVDDAADELWVAKSVDFDDAKIKIGEGLCGHAAATGRTVNVIDSYEDPRFDRRWDKQTGFVTKGCVVFCVHTCGMGSVVLRVPSVLCVPIPPPDHVVLCASPAAGGGSRGGMWAGAGDGPERRESNGSLQDGSAELPRRDDGGTDPRVSMGVDGFQPTRRGVSQQQPAAWEGGRAPPPPQPNPRRRRSSKMPARPLAVLEVINKRGNGVFNEHDEIALVGLCARIELLLRNKAAEVTLLYSGMTERSLIRQRNGGGGGGGGDGEASTNYARVESTIMRLYSEAPFLADAAVPGEQQQRAPSQRDDTAARGGDVGGGCPRRCRRRPQRSMTDTEAPPGMDVGQTGEGDGVRRRGGSDSSVSLGTGAASGEGEGCPSGAGGSGGGGGGPGVDRPISAESTQEESELVDLGMNLFNLSSEQLLSLVGRFFRNMELTDRFQTKMAAAATGFKEYLHGPMDAGTKLKVEFRTGDIGLGERRRRFRNVDDEDDKLKCECGSGCEDRVHVVAEHPLYKKEREVYMTEIGKVGGTYMEMFEAWNRQEKTVAISEQKMQNFARGVERRYRPNSFHNLTHAVSVTHASFTIVKTTQVNSLLRPLDKLALLVAAFCHDIDHPGNNNAYEVNSLSPLALQHGDSSVLERHHVYVTYQASYYHRRMAGTLGHGRESLRGLCDAFVVLLEEGGANNIFSGLTRAQFRDVRQTIVQAILGTDMSGHMQHCADVFQCVQKAKKLAAFRGRGCSGGRASASCVASRQGKDRAGRSLSPVAKMETLGGGDAAQARRAVGLRTTRASCFPPGGGGGDDVDSPAKKRSKSAAIANGLPGCSSGARKNTRGRNMWTPPPSPPAEHLFSVDKAEDRSFLTKTILHCADLSGQVLDNHLALEWGRRILEEFRLQARLEGNAGLPLTTVASGDRETTMKGQHFFATKIVKPLWQPFTLLFPKLAPLLDNLNNNCDYYHQEWLRLEQQRLSASSASNAESLQRPGEERAGRRAAANENKDGVISYWGDDGGAAAATRIPSCESSGSGGCGVGFPRPYSSPPSSGLTPASGAAICNGDEAAAADGMCVDPLDGEQGGGEP